MTDGLFSILAILGEGNGDIASEDGGTILTCILAPLFLSPMFKWVGFKNNFFSLSYRANLTFES